MRRTFAVVMLVLVVGCAKAPPTLSPQAQVAFKQTQVIKAMDLIRDTAIAANATTPPLLPERTTGIVVTWHRTAITIVRAAGTGWQAAALRSLDELPQLLPPGDRAQLQPYLVLARTLVEELTRTTRAWWELEASFRVSADGQLLEGVR